MAGSLKSRPWNEVRPHRPTLPPTVGLYSRYDAAVAMGDGTCAAGDTGRRPSGAGLLLALVAAASLGARSATFHFAQANPASVARYRLLLGLESRDYPWSFDLGPQAVASNGIGVIETPAFLSDAARVYVAMVAVGADGSESIPSNEILLTPPGVRGPDDGVADDGDWSGAIGDRRCADGSTRRCDDNCPLVPNGPRSGTCLDGDPARLHRLCMRDLDCGAAGLCSLAQEDR